MLVEHRGHRPAVPPSAYVAPSAVLCGAVVLGERARVLHGAVLTAEDGEIRVGADVVIMENALVRGRARHPAVLGDAVLVGPHAHVNGATVDDEVFVATGASLFPGSVAGTGSELRIGSVLHVNSKLPAGTVVPIGWIAAGDPAQLFPPDRHDELWEVQRQLDFPGTVYGVARDTPMRTIMARQVEFYGAHRADRVLDEDDPSEPG
ncbi:gamma carbonic anhydrase family protein [Pseudonocardia zijingensis]|jgi:carbonic anhydrase/acetyltransferase-like protein (isoleucine patch superfamily)|uniref:Carbonic anhydrase/acetyltransferase-like protein (Isoleucine patch superfamily) n=1 Tax=Pseudonocardia zijingensis TaxID=153376 RepID=A0ABP3ZY43_9PSEU